jgi:hypothetical protein
MKCCFEGIVTEFKLLWRSEKIIVIADAEDVNIE